jgi:F0F1-type ATP synthase membrane subunit b/b'
MERAALRAQEIAREAEAESRRQCEQAEQHLDETAEFIVERVVKH